MFSKAIKTILFLICNGLTLAGSNALSETLEEKHLYLGFLSRSQSLPSEIQSYLLSTANSYKGANAGVDVHCFWTKNKYQIDQYIKAVKESEKSPNQEMSFSYEVQWGKELILSNYSGNLFDAGQNDSTAKQIKLDRACISIYPSSLTKENQIRQELVTSYANIEKAQSLISLLAILEKDSANHVEKISEINKELKSIINDLESSNQITAESRQKFLKEVITSVEGSPQLRSERAYQILLESLTERAFFVPKHRYGTFLSQLYDIHKNLVSAPISAPTVWTRNQIWTQKARSQFLIDFRVTTNEELCENYFAYSLPIFLHAVADELDRGQLISTGSHRDINNSLTNFRNKIIPELIKSCKFQKSIQFLDRQIYNILSLLPQKTMTTISEENAKSREWSLYFPNKPYMNQNGHPLVELFMNWNPQDSLLERNNKMVTNAGGVQFFTFNSPSEVAVVLSRMGLVYWQGESMCAFSFWPLLHMRSTIGNQYDTLSSCVNNNDSYEKNLGWLFNFGTRQPLNGPSIQSGYSNLTLQVKFKNYQFEPPMPQVSFLAKINYLISEIHILGGTDFNKKYEDDKSSNGTNYRACQLPNTRSSQRDFSNCDFERANLSGLNLSSYSFEGANLEGADLRNTNLSQSNLRGARLRGAIYARESIVQGTTFPTDLEQQSSSAKEMLAYEDCSWGYDKYCANSPLNPRDCLKEAVQSNRDIPLQCVKALGGRFTPGVSSEVKF